MKRAHTYFIEKRLCIGRIRDGKEILSKISAFMETNQPPGTILPINFKKVEVIGWGTADEIISNLLNRFSVDGVKDRYICIESANESVKDNIDTVLKLRKLVCICYDNDKPIILGPIGKELKTMYYFIIGKGHVTSRDIINSGMLKTKNISAACNRLKKMLHLGLVRKNRSETILGGGLQNYYEAVF
jgi:hypothetical protein